MFLRRNPFNYHQIPTLCSTVTDGNNAYPTTTIYEIVLARIKSPTKNTLVTFKGKMRKNGE